MGIRVLVVDDFELWRRLACVALEREPGFELVGEAADGVIAVQRAQELQPDLILLDIGLPGLNGILAAPRIRELSPKSKIVFLTEDHSREMAQEGIRRGGSAYLVKSEAGRELLPAVKAVLRGELFVSACLGFMDDDSIPEQKKQRVSKREGPVPPKNTNMCLTGG